MLPTLRLGGNVPPAYKKNSIGVFVPILHKVVYHKDPRRIADTYVTYRDHLIHQWLKENCHHNYYCSPGYFHEKSIEFECPEEAVLFRIVWGITCAE
jgi:hypothetical protein